VEVDMPREWMFDDEYQVDLDKEVDGDGDGDCNMAFLQLGTIPDVEKAIHTLMEQVHQLACKVRALESKRGT